MPPAKSIRKLLSDRNEPATLSPIGDLTRPNCLLFNDATTYRRLFFGRLMNRSPRRVRRKGLLHSFLNHSSLLKMETDVAQGFDVSIVPYHLDMDLPAWGIVLDRVGRVFDVTFQRDGMLEFTYQGGCSRNKQEWETLVGSQAFYEEDNVRRFYNRVKMMARDRVLVAGTLGFGLWDALWMSLDFESAYQMLTNDPDFVGAVLDHWKRFHLGAAQAMLDAGIKMIFFREHPGGFPEGRGIASRIDPFIREHLNELSRGVRSRGGCLFFDCDADEMIETDYPVKWGFDGLGPMLFRDGNDMFGARASLDEQLILVGSMSFAHFRGPLFNNRNLSKGIVMAGKSCTRERRCGGAYVQPEQSYIPSTSWELAS
jgi:hypothetical protein